MHKIYRTEIDCVPTVGDRLTDCYRNVWQVTKTCPDYIIACKIEKNYSERC